MMDGILQNIEHIINCTLLFLEGKSAARIQLRREKESYMSKLNLTVIALVSFHQYITFEYKFISHIYSCILVLQKIDYNFSISV